MRSDHLSVVIVSVLSGGGKASVLRTLEDLGYEAVDNPPLPMLEDMFIRTDRQLAIGIDARTRGFNAKSVLIAIERLRHYPNLRVDLVYAWAHDRTLLRRYTESRRRHPLSPEGRVTDGIAAEVALTEELRSEPDLVVDTSTLTPAQLRQLVNNHFGLRSTTSPPAMAVTLLSFAYPKGLPQEADLVFDARFLRNPHYVTGLRERTGLDEEIGEYIEEDRDFTRFLDAVTELFVLLLPIFVTEGKKYVTLAVGCTGGQHRSVYCVEMLARRLSHTAFAGHGNDVAWRIYVSHRELPCSLSPRLRLIGSTYSNLKNVMTGNDPSDSSKMS